MPDIDLHLRLLTAAPTQIEGTFQQIPFFFRYSRGEWTVAFPHNPAAQPALYGLDPDVWFYQGVTGGALGESLTLPEAAIFIAQSGRTFLAQRDHPTQYRAPQLRDADTGYKRILEYPLAPSPLPGHVYCVFCGQNLPAPDFRRGHATWCPYVLAADWALLFRDGGLPTPRTYRDLEEGTTYHGIF